MVTWYSMLQRRYNIAWPEDYTPCSLLWQSVILGRIDAAASYDATGMQKIYISGPAFEFLHESADCKHPTCCSKKPEHMQSTGQSQAGLAAACSIEASTSAVSGRHITSLTIARASAPS